MSFQGSFAVVHNAMHSATTCVFTLQVGGILQEVASPCTCDFSRFIFGNILDLPLLNKSNSGQNKAKDT